MKRTLLSVALTLTLVPASASTAPEPAPPDDSRAVFSRLLSLAGTWTGASTRGWESRISIEPIARDSAVVSRSRFEAHPDETMVTVYHLDRDRLMLTHYCVSRTQPRLILTSWKESTGEAVFEYLDGTGLASRNQGHMDRVVLYLGDLDRDRISSRWSWYEDGSERWMEEISYRRTE